MESLRIAPTNRSPAIDLDVAGRLLTISGESYPEDVGRFYGPVLAALEGVLKRPDLDRLTVRFQLVYFNSSSAKAILNLLRMLEAAAAGGCAIAVEWLHAPDDDGMAEMGADFAEDLSAVGFRIVPLA